MRAIERLRFIAPWIAALVVAACSLPGGTMLEAGPPVVTYTGSIDLGSEDCPAVDIGGDRVQLIFDAGFGVDGNPPQVSFNGEVVAADGNRVHVRGTQDAGETLCGPGVPLLVTAVERAP
jgi:hypothetical protein